MPGFTNNSGQEFEFERALMACRAVRPEEYRPDLWKLWVKVVTDANGKVPPDYPGRIFKHCEECGIEVQVGPRQQAAILQMGEENVQIACLVCASAILVREKQADPSATFGMVNMGNPYKDPEP